MPEKITDISKKIVDTFSYAYVREVNRDPQGNRLYETTTDVDLIMPELFDADDDNDGWTLLDVQTANLLIKSYEATTHKEHFNKVDLTNLVAICWRSVK